MPSTFSPIGRIELQADDENANTWGQKLNAGIGFLEKLFGGMTTVVHNDSASITLSTANAQADQARAQIIRVTGNTLTATRRVILPNVTKTYVLVNSTNRPLTFETANPAFTLTIPSNRYTFAYCNGNRSLFACMNWMSSLYIDDGGKIDYDDNFFEFVSNGGHKFLSGNSELLRLNSNGSVYFPLPANSFFGIGQENPLAQLHMKGHNGAQAWAILESQSQLSAFRFHAPTNDNGHHQIVFNKDLGFYFNNLGGVASNMRDQDEVMRISNDSIDMLKSFIVGQESTGNFVKIAPSQQNIRNIGGGEGAIMTISRTNYSGTDGILDSLVSFRGNPDNAFAAQGNLGYIYYNTASNTLGFYSFSDRKYKKDIKTLKGGDVISKLRPVKYTLKHNDKESVGFIANEVKKILPNSVVKDKETKSLVMNEKEMIPHLVASVQELQKQMKQKDRQIESLQKQVKSLKSARKRG